VKGARVGKLFKLKKWLTVSDAAQHLSIIFGEEVKEADVLRLTLDGHLKLSVNFVNHTKGKCGKIVPIEEAKYFAFSFPAVGVPSIPDECKGKPILTLSGININDREVLELDDAILTLDGIYDLPMLGGERLDVEHAYQRQTDGPTVTLSNLAGAFVTRNDGQMCQLQEDFDDNEYQDGSNGQLQKLKQYIVQNRIKAAQAKILLDQHKEKRNKFLEERKRKKESANYYPAAGLPRDGVLVVRTDALREFEASVNDIDPKAEKPLGDRAETTYLNIIGGLLGLLLGKSPAGKPQSVFENQATVIDGLLAHHDGKPGISRRTLEEKFAVAKRNLTAS
jgi:hypothetical protein